MAIPPWSGAVIPAHLRGALWGGLWIPLCLTPGWQQRDPKQEVGGSWVGMKPAGGQSICCCLPCWSRAGISATSPRDVSGDGTWQGTLPICADGSPAPVLGPSPPPLPGWPCFLLPPPPSTPCPGTCRSWQRLAHRPGVACVLPVWPRALLPQILPGWSSGPSGRGLKCSTGSLPGGTRVGHQRVEELLLWPRWQFFY